MWSNKNKEGSKMQDDKKDVSKLQLFLTFIKADKRCSPQFTKDLKRRIPGNKLDFPLLRYVFSLEERLNMLTILRDKIHKSNKEAIDEMERIQENGSGTNEKSLNLVVYYESFLNQIYNIMENLAIINLFMFDAIKESPPDHFSDQVKKIKNRNLKFHPSYDKLIEEEMDWYDEVHRIRSTTNHFVVGMIIFGRTDEGGWIPQYMNFDIPHTADEYFKIERNILKDTDFFYESTIKTLNQISGIYIERIDKEKPCAVTFIGKDEIEFRELSFTEYMSGQKGKLIQFPVRRK